MARAAATAHRTPVQAAIKISSEACSVVGLQRVRVSPARLPDVVALHSPPHQASALAFQGAYQRPENGAGLNAPCAMRGGAVLTVGAMMAAGFCTSASWFSRSVSML
jgi:hypothetical protein